MASAKNFLKDDEKDAVVAAIRQVELHTSGEIRVHIDDRCEQDAYQRAVTIFEHLNMDKMPFRNAVLIYIAVKDRKFSIIGDEAIHEKLGDGFWKEISRELHNDFENYNFSIGIINTIETIGKELIKYFPNIDELDRNELPDDISFE